MDSVSPDTTEYNSMSEVLGVSVNVVSWAYRVFKEKGVYRLLNNRYVVSDKSLTSEDKALIIENLKHPIKITKIEQGVEVLNTVTNEAIAYSSVSKAAAAIGCDVITIHNSIKNLE